MIRRLAILVILWSLLEFATAGIISSSEELTAQSWLVADADNKILDSKDTIAVRSIGSITKLMTVLAVKIGRAHV